MKLIFCADPLHRSEPDEMYQSEASTVASLGYTFSLIDYEALVNDKDPIKATRRVTQENNIEIGIYRGWMLKPFQYEQLYEVLQGKGINLVNNPMAYRHCHLMRCLQVFGNSPVVVKDYVKSQKHYWSEAFFIPSANSRESVERVVNRFIELQGKDLNEGLVFREFVEFEPLTIYSKSGMPLTKEFAFLF